MQSATIYKIKNNNYLIYSDIKTVSGFRIASDPFLIVKVGASVSVLADAIKEVLNHDESLVLPDPKNWSEFRKDFLRKTGLKSLKHLNNNKNKNVSCKKEGGQIIFTPTFAPSNSNQGFLHKSKEYYVQIRADSGNEEIVTALEACFARCE